MRGESPIALFCFRISRDHLNGGLFFVLPFLYFRKGVSTMLNVLHIRRLREAQGLTLGELAQRSNVPLATVSGYERYVQNPRIEYLLRIARALRVELRELIAIDDSMAV